MILKQQDKDDIVAIVAARYFSENNWKWLNLRKDLPLFFKAFEEIKEQYAKYPYMSRDWYVENSATKSIHMSNNWDELQYLADFLNDNHQNLNFMVKVSDGKKIFCIASNNGNLTHEQENTITLAKRINYDVIVFSVSIPDSIEFDIIQ